MIFNKKILNRGGYGLKRKGLSQRKIAKMVGFNNKAELIKFVGTKMHLLSSA